MFQNTIERISDSMFQNITRDNLLADCFIHLELMNNQNTTNNNNNINTNNNKKYKNLYSKSREGTR